MNGSTFLTPHFSLAEMTHSAAATRAGMTNRLPEELLPNLILTAETLELVRALLGTPIQVLSGYRSVSVNALVGGSATSEHKKARAADIIAPRFGSPLQVARRIQASPIAFNQLIYEGGDWVHISIPEQGKQPRMEVLTAVFRRGQPTQYLPGLVPQKGQS